MELLEIILNSNEQQKELIIIDNKMQNLNDKVIFESLLILFFTLHKTNQRFTKFQLCILIDALQTISRQQYELNQAHLQCYWMAIKFSENDNNYFIYKIN